ncbi:MAG TPA: DUF3147 family protein [Gaiellaceae bacterium]|nr:DUF3147 family protein [Gaiellaceae bacterium]
MRWSDVATIAIKTVEGGVLVVLFAVVADVVRPKRFSGIFAAAPAVALAGMTVSGVAKGAREVHLSAAGMIAGGIGIVLYCGTVFLLHLRIDAFRAALAALPIWFAVAAAAYLLVVR